MLRMRAACPYRRDLQARKCGQAIVAGRADRATTPPGNHPQRRLSMLSAVVAPRALCAVHHSTRRPALCMEVCGSSMLGRSPCQGNRTPYSQGHRDMWRSCSSRSISVRWNTTYRDSLSVGKSIDISTRHVSTSAAVAAAAKTPKNETGGGHEGGSTRITFETGKIGLLADGFVVAKERGTVVMVSTVSDRKRMDETGFLPLSVEYREKAHASGKIPRTASRREGRETDDEVLVARVVDRVLRPLFPPGYCFETQVVATVQALGAGGDPVVVAINAASAALCVSNIPWDGPAGCVRIGRVNGRLVVNPPRDSFSPTGWKDGGGLDLLYAGNRHRALMIEMGGGPVPERFVMKALALAHAEVAPLIDAQRALQREIGKAKVLPRVDAAPSEDMLLEAMRIGLPDAASLFAVPEGDGLTEGGDLLSKAERGRAEGAILGGISHAIAQSFPEAPRAAASAAAEAVLKKAMRRAIVEDERRPDGRAAGDARPLTGEADVLPTVHGSGLFTRGQTQTLATVTLGPGLDAFPQRFIGQERERPEDLNGRLYLHYEFPPYCVNETGKIGGVNRRMVGHGNLAERSILPVMPDTEAFPYTTRVSAEVTMSNGSSSMATTCATSLALMDAGVPVSAPVGGISVGLMTTDAPPDGEDIGPHALLLDIQGTEDHYGDMDFKVAGTAAGITAVQLDVKLRGGVPLGVLGEAFKVAKAGRTKVLAAMKKAISAPNPELKARAPRCEIVQFEPDRKKDLVGFQGQTLKGIEENYGVSLDLSKEGRAVVFSDDSKSVKEAVKLVQELVHEIDEGDVFEGTVRTVQEYGCLVELLRNQQGLLHVSNMTDVIPAPPARDMVKVGDTVDVRVVEVDRIRGLIKLVAEKSPRAKGKRPKQEPAEADQDEESLRVSQ